MSTLPITRIPKERLNSLSYFDAVKRPDERVLFEGKIHWMVYVAPAIVATIGLLTFNLLSAIVFILAFFLFVRAYNRRNTTEIVITDKRVLLKKYLFARSAQQINLSKIETVDLIQSVFQRMFGSGYIIIRGTGGTWEPIGPVEKPVDLRNASEWGDDIAAKHPSQRWASRCDRASNKQGVR